MSGADRSANVPAPSASARRLTIAAAIALALYFAIAVLSHRFGPDTPLDRRPVILTLCLFVMAFGWYFVSLYFAVRAAPTRQLVRRILLFSIAFRLVLLFSWPILEIDIYRYMWDGAVVASGVNPYRYSPDQVLAAAPDSSIPHDLAILARIRNSDPELATVLQRIHYGNLATIYPPVSQAVFAGVSWITPAGASVFQRMLILKSILIVFDLATLVLVLQLLQSTGRHVGWAIAYGWCPLVLKEIANTGHLDAIAVCLTTLTLVWLIKLATRAAPRPWASVFAVSSALALAIGAKIYPATLVPLFCAIIWNRFGIRHAVATCAVTGGVSIILLWPMVGDRLVEFQPSVTPSTTAETPPIPIDTSDPAAVAASFSAAPSGLRAFVQRWEMNDWLFALVAENLRPDDSPAWFVVTSRSWRAAWITRPARRLGMEPQQFALLAARMTVLVVFLTIAGALVLTTCASDEPAQWLRAAMLTLAWFWLLSPTQNPWYWVWVMPLVVYARSRAWLAMSGLLFLYYLRFWCGLQWPTAPVWGLPYSGKQFFDFVIVWCEFLPWFVILGAESVWRKRRPQPVESNLVG